MAQNQPNLNQTRQDIQDIAAVTEETFRSVAANIQDMFANALNASDTVIKSFQKDISNSIKSAARESSKLADNFEKMNQGVLKQADIQKQIEARAAKLRSIEVSTAALRKIGTAEAISQANELNKQYRDLVTINQFYTEQLNNQVKILDEVDKEIGLLGGALGGIGTLMKNLGLTSISKPINDAIENTKKYKIQQKTTQNEIKLTQENINQLNSRNLSNAQLRVGFGGKELKNLIEQKDALEKQNEELGRKSNKYRNLLVSLKEELTLVNLTDAIIAKTAQSFFKLNEAQTDFRRLTGNSITLQSQFNTELITSVDYIKTAVSLTEKLGLNAQSIFPSDTLATAAEMVTAMGATQEQANQAAIFSKIYGKNLNDVNASIVKGTNSFNATNKSALAGGAILKDVYSTSTEIAVSLGKNPDRLAEAARQAKNLGLSLEQVDKIADSLLNVEQSIAAEFEAEVITGKQLNLEAARYYALTNQTDKLGKEIANNQNVITSFATDNRIEQEAIAKTLGLSRKELADMYVTDQLRRGLKAEEIAQNTNIELSDIKRLTIQESINKSIEKMTQLLAGPLEAMVSLIDSAGIFYGIMGAIAGIITTKIVLGVIEMGKGLILAIPRLATILGLESGIAAAKISGAMAATVGLGAIAILGGIALGVGALMSSVNQAQSTPGLAEGGTVTSGGTVMVGENGPEMLSLKPGATVTPLTKLNAATVQSPSSPTINNDALGKVIGEHVANAFRQTPVQTIFPDQEYGRRYQQTIAGVTTRKI
jgi:hypothetical protein